MASYTGHQWYVKPGDDVSPTTDCFTFGGCVQLGHEDTEVLQRDYNRSVVVLLCVDQEILSSDWLCWGFNILCHQ